VILYGQINTHAQEQNEEHIKLLSHPLWPVQLKIFIYYENKINIGNSSNGCIKKMGKMRNDYVRNPNIRHQCNIQENRTVGEYTEDWMEQPCITNTIQ
jgi:hypothetical protein